MKDQYFGDINDYRKYGILRALDRAGLPVGVHWMLTPGDASSDGRKLGYLRSPLRWRQFDPPLFDALAIAVQRGEREVRAFERTGLLTTGTYFGEHVPDRGTGRTAHFSRAVDGLAGASVIFFDPDNGIEVPSKPLARRGSAKYVYWKELSATWAMGHSLLVYQHYPRVERAVFEARLRQSFVERTGASPCFLHTGHVLFVLLSRPEHLEQSNKALDELAARWRGEIAISRRTDNE